MFTLKETLINERYRLEDEIGNYTSAIKTQLEAREYFQHFDDQAGIDYTTNRLSLTLIKMGEYGEAKRAG